MICERCGTVFCWDEADEAGEDTGRRKYCSRSCSRNSKADAKAERARRLREPCPANGKAPYLSRPEAEAAAFDRALKGYGLRHPYQCETCGRWHLTSGITVSARKPGGVRNSSEERVSRRIAARQRRRGGRR